MGADRQLDKLQRRFLPQLREYSSSSFSAVVVSTLLLIEAFAFAALVFSGPLSAELHRGVGLFLMGVLVGGMVFPLFAVFKGVVAGPRSPQVAILAAMASQIADELQGRDAKVVMSTVMFGILAASAMTGLFMYGASRSRIGSLARFMPYPVIAGFFSGLGLLIFLGGLDVALAPMVDTSWHEPRALAQFLPAIGLAGTIIYVRRKLQLWYLPPLIIAGSLVLFNTAVTYVGNDPKQYSIAYAVQEMIGSARGWQFISPFTPTDLSSVDFGALYATVPSIAALAAVATTMLLIEISWLELELNRQIDPKRALRSAGLGNLCAALLGAPLSGPSAIETAQAKAISGTRATMLPLRALLPLGMLVIWPRLLFYVPAWLVGGLLLLGGFEQLQRWFWEARRSLPRAELFAVAIIALTIAIYGIMPGIAVGVAISATLFLYRYSRLNFIRAVLNGDQFISNVDRHPTKQAYLARRGGTIRIIQLQGALFFGTAYKLVELVTRLAGDSKDFRYLVLDFHRVESIDSSALHSFARLIQICDKGRIRLLLANCSPDAVKLFEAFHTDRREADFTDGVHLCADADAAFNWCCDRLLEAYHAPQQEGHGSADELLGGLFEDGDNARIIAGYMQAREAAAGEVLFSVGDPGECLYLIGSGSVGIEVTMPNGSAKVLRTIRAGAIFGEMALFTGAPRSASAVITEGGLLYSFDRKAHEALSKSNPRAATAFNALIVRIMSERLERANRQVAALSA